MPVPPKVKAGCGAALLFFAGMITGVIAFFALLVFLIPRSEGWKRNESKDFLASHFARQLELTEDQRRKLRPGFDAFLEDRWKLRRSYLKDDRQLLEDYFAKVEEELEEKQIEKGRKILERWWKSKRAMVGPE